MGENVNNENMGTHSFSLRKNAVKLKSCNVGWVFSVRLGNVEKNALAKRAAIRS